MNEKFSPSITETQLKLRDAATQMKLALQNHNNPEVLRSCVNSYISHARSVTFVMQKESAHCPELKIWYEKEMVRLQQIPIMDFFNAKRIQTIHRGNVKFAQKSTEIRNVEYSNGRRYAVGEMSMWVFDDMQRFIPGDNGNVFRLCEQYFFILKKFVHAWLAQKAKLETK